MARRKKEGLSGREKAAILLVILGPEISAQVFKHLDEEDVEQLTLEIANLPMIPPEVKNDVIQEFQHLLVAHEFMAKGGVNYAKELLEKAFGPEKAKEILTKL
ncbi:MAG: flagellar motor switch protein FliG, partial [Synergistetes bacterium]|nr:flagellar motor switch protein FliG [Synergistota bacterium]